MNHPDLLENQVRNDHARSKHPTEYLDQIGDKKVHFEMLQRRGGAAVFRCTVLIDERVQPSATPEDFEVYRASFLSALHKANP